MKYSHHPRPAITRTIHLAVGGQLHKLILKTTIIHALHPKKTASVNREHAVDLATYGESGKGRRGLIRSFLVQSKHTHSLERYVHIYIKCIGFNFPIFLCWLFDPGFSRHDNVPYLTSLLEDPSHPPSSPSTASPSPLRPNFTALHTVPLSCT